MQLSIRQFSGDSAHNLPLWMLEGINDIKLQIPYEEMREIIDCKYLSYLPRYVATRARAQEPRIWKWASGLPPFQKCICEIIHALSEAYQGLFDWYICLLQKEKEIDERIASQLLAALSPADRGKYLVRTWGIDHQRLPEHQICIPVNPEQRHCKSTWTRQPNPSNASKPRQPQTESIISTSLSSAPS